MFNLSKLVLFSLGVAIYLINHNNRYARSDSEQVDPLGVQAQSDGAIQQTIQRHALIIPHLHFRQRQPDASLHKRRDVHVTVRGADEHQVSRAGGLAEEGDDVLGAIDRLEHPEPSTVKRVVGRVGRLLLEPLHDPLPLGRATVRSAVPGRFATVEEELDASVWAFDAPEIAGFDGPSLDLAGECFRDPRYETESVQADQIASFDDGAEKVEFATVGYLDGYDFVDAVGRIVSSDGGDIVIGIFIGVILKNPVDS